MYRFILFIGLFWLQSVLATDADELLQPDQAFQLTAKVITADKVKLSWQIADGYYLYRQKFNFNSLTTGITLTEPKFPTGENKHDQFFGTVEIYHDHLELDLPITRQNPEINKIDLEISYQGCAEIGACYLPIQKRLTLDLTAEHDGWFGF
jgi:thioredoxin:protein disulfide reductase